MDEKAKDVEPRQPGSGGPLENRRPDIEFFEGGPDTLHDPRTDEQWFKGLDAITRSDFKRDWTVSRQIDLNRKRIRKESASRGWKEGLAVFFLANTVFAPFWMSWYRTVAAIVFGVIVGNIWYRVQAGRFQAIAIGLPFQLFLVISVSGIPRSMPDAIHVFMNPLAFVALAGIVGATREFRKADGSEI